MRKDGKQPHKYDLCECGAVKAKKSKTCLACYRRDYVSPMKGKVTIAERTCIVEGCQKSSLKKDWGKRLMCAMHYRRWFNHGDPTINKLSNRGQGFIDRHGYRMIYREGYYHFEHRYIMEQHLGRKLNRKTEVIHHINGKKLDNRIQNLIIVTQSDHIKIHRDMMIAKRWPKQPKTLSSLRP